MRQNNFILAKGNLVQRIQIIRDHANTGTEEALDDLIRSNEFDRSQNLRKEIALSLGSFDNPKAGSILESMLSDESIKIQWNAAYSLSRLDTYQPLQFIRKVVEGKDREQWCLALQCVNRSGLESYENPIRKGLNKEDPFIVSTTISVLAKHKGVDFLDELRGYTKSKEVTIRENAYRSLIELDQDVGELMSHDDNKIVRTRAELLEKKANIEKPYDPILEDKFIGAVIASAIGDALGSPIEQLSYNGIMRRFGFVDKYHKRECRDHELLDAGEWTDDTESAVSVGKCLINLAGIDPVYLGGLFGENADRADSREDKDRGYSALGGITSRKLRLGVNWRYTGEDTNGCGSIMRTYPIGLFFHDDSKRLIENSVLQTAVTHNGNTAVYSTCLLSYAVGKLISYDPEDNPLDEKFIDDMIGFASLCKEKRIEEDLREFKKYKDIDIPELVVMKKTGFGAIGTITVAIASYFRNADNFMDAITTAINHDGDSDSVGSMTGAMAGTYLGFKRLPQHLVDGLYKKNELIEFAKSLYAAYRKKSHTATALSSSDLSLVVKSTSIPFSFMTL